METLTKNNNNIELSLIIPAYKADSYIKEAIVEKLKILDSLNINYELIVVLDGKSEESENALLSIQNKNLKIIHYEQNQGKGFAVKYGCMQAKGKYIGYTDADNDIDVSIISEMYNRIKLGDVDMVIPSKFHKDSKINQVVKRKIFSRLFSLYTKLILFMPINDTQLGAKMFKKQVIKEVMPRVIIKRFAFDAEVLRVAFYYGFKKFTEVPVKLDLKTQSTVKIKDGLKSAQDILAIFYRLRIKRYYDLDRKFFLKESKFQFSKIIML